MCSGPDRGKMCALVAKLLLCRRLSERLESAILLSLSGFGNGAADGT